MKPLQNSNRRGLHRSLGRAARAQRFYGLWSPLPGRAKVFLSPRIVAKFPLKYCVSTCNHYLILNTRLILPTVLFQLGLARTITPLTGVGDFGSNIRYSPYYVALSLVGEWHFLSGGASALLSILFLNLPRCSYLTLLNADYLRLCLSGRKLK